ncbi:uncharacterized protein ces2b [Nelusetta ayraudi]|uniref:uncharacterized protein ces2b n=1 Tax=Nelusetta ayraudi TaxID=303726 RepID=UPI003F7311B5
MGFLRRQRFLLLLSVLFVQVAAGPQEPEVHTKLGSLKGLYANVEGKRSGAHAYLGVPFAKPPVGPLRLVAPQPVEAWGGVRDATKQPPMCVQNKEVVAMLLEAFDFKMIDIPDISEDCLYLNIYTPANIAPNAKLPVMFWIHGGGFALGSASMTDASALAAYQDVVVVVIQYRLGVLGFVSTGDEHLPGNYALLDQVQALRWTQEHIHNFGGDPNSVTIFGESAGGVSVNLLLLSPLAKGLFHRAIAESGTALMDALIIGTPLHTAQILANRSGCSAESTKEIADCMKKVDFDTLVSFAKDGTIQYPMSIDGHFLEKPVSELIQKQEFLTVPFITGVNNHEGGWMLTNHFGGPNWTEGVDQQQFVQIMSFFYPGPEKGLFRDLVTDAYTGNGEDRKKNRDGLTELLGDTLFVFPAIKTVNAHRDAGAPVYLYEFQHIPSVMHEKRPSFVKSDHGDELFSVFGICFTSQQAKLNTACSEEDKQMGKTIMSYWGNFARTGSPNGQGLVHWPKYGAGEEYLEIQAKEQVVRRQLMRDRFIAFTETFPEKNEQHKPEVHTKLGSLKGLYTSVKGKRSGVHSYLGVPFAKPPVGPLRLVAPQPVEPWGGVRDATKLPSMCVQNKVEEEEFLKYFSFDLSEPIDISEDCLYLNIYTPATRAPNAKLPVMVWIHGGGFILGSASSYDGSALAAYQDVVVVAIQYRLGLLGLLSTGDEHLPGNFGMLDQIQALRWTKEHIHNFGGDPNSVTIFGESAGGVSVNLLLLSPLSKGLFQRAIAESGTALTDELIGGNPLKLAQRLADQAGCSVKSTKAIADCMKKIDLDTIISLAQDLTVWYPMNVDGHFLKKPINELIQKQEFLTVPLMTGVTDHEAGWILRSFFGGIDWAEGVDRQQIVELMSKIYPGPERALFRDLMMEEYIGSGEDRIKNRDGLTELLGDNAFVVPAIQIANNHRDAGALVYLYEFQHIPSFMRERRPSFVTSDHADELFSVFGMCFTTQQVKLGAACSEEDKQMSKTIMSYWGNFARTGSPDGQGLVHWPRYGVGEEYLQMQAKEQVVRRQLKRDRFITIAETIPKKIQQQSQKKHSEL